MKKPHKNNQRLKALMSEHGLTRKDVSELLGKPMPGGRTPAVDKWLSPRPSGSEYPDNYRPMPDSMLELLEIKLTWELEK